MKSRVRSIRSVLFLLICIQPFMDVVSYWMNALGGSNELTLFIRFGLLALTVLWGFRHSRRKKVYGALAVFSIVFLAAHSFACRQAGYADPAADLTNQIRILVLPWTTLSFMTFLEQDPGAYNTIRRSFLICFLLILTVEILATVTGTDPHTYANKGIGVCGWFYFPNSQSAILTMLIPVAMCLVLEKKPGAISALLVSSVCFGTLYLFATRLSYFGVAFTGLILGLGYLLKGKATRSQGLVILSVMIVFMALYPVSPMTKNQTAMNGNYEKRQVWIDEQLALSEGQEEPERLEPIYEEFLPGLVEHFGLERTVKAYDSRTDCHIADVRAAKLTYSKLLLQDSPGSSKLFGMEISRWVTSSGSYDVENDLHGIFFLCGGFGLAAMLAFFLFFVLRSGLFILRNPKELFSPHILGWGTSVLLCAAHIYATAGVLRRPNANFYLAVCLAVIWYLTGKQKNAPLHTDTRN